MQAKQYIKVSSYEGRKGDVKKVVLLYSGGLDTSMMLKWIADEYEAEVIALTIDIGQQADDLEQVRQKALDIGATKAIVVDAKKEFAYHYIAWGIKANSSYQGKYHLSTPIGRPLLAKIAVDVARKYEADTIAHGCTGKGNDQVRIEGTVLTLAPEMKIIAPVREWSMGRDEQLEYVQKHNIPVKQTKDSPYSYDDNMWGVTGESGEIENPEMIPPLDKILQVCRLPQEAPDESELVELEFVRGLPVALNGKNMQLHSLIMQLNEIGAKHAVGITHHIEDRLVGLKVRGLYEAPAAEIIIQAHFNLEKYVSTRYENEFKTEIDNKWAYLCYGGLWYEPLLQNLNAYLDEVSQKVTGTVKVRLYKGCAEVVAVESPNALYKERLATFMKSEGFNQNCSAGFTEIYSLQMKTAQEKKLFALLTLGEDKNKKKYESIAQQLVDLGFEVYATEGTHRYFQKHDIPSILIHKMHEHLNPSLEDLLRQDRFDLIIHEPYDKKTTESAADEKIIREWAVKTETKYIDNYDVAQNYLKKLRKRLVVRNGKK